MAARTCCHSFKTVLLVAAATPAILGTGADARQRQEVKGGSLLRGGSAFSASRVEVAALTSRPNVTLALAAARTLRGDDAPPCSPQCTWQCQTPKCDQVCAPVCQAPRCETRCQAADTSGCETKCDQPQCNVVCPQRQCGATDCAGCTAHCSEPMCLLNCPRAQPCRNVCEEPVCTWQCSQPTVCPKPVCHMVCENPKNCPSTRTTMHKNLPPLESGEVTMQAFKAPQTANAALPGGVEAIKGPAPVAPGPQAPAGVAAAAAPAKAAPAAAVAPAATAPKTAATAAAAKAPAAPAAVAAFGEPADVEPGEHALFGPTDPAAEAHATPVALHARASQSSQQETPASYVNFDLAG